MADSVKADLDQLDRLSRSIDDLADKVGKVRAEKGAVKPFHADQHDLVMTSHLAAVTITETVLHDALVKGAKARLTGVSDSMAYVAKQYRDTDEQARDKLAAEFRTTAGEWGTEPK